MKPLHIGRLGSRRRHWGRGDHEGGAEAANAALRLHPVAAQVQTPAPADAGHRAGRRREPQA